MGGKTRNTFNENRANTLLVKRLQALITDAPALAEYLGCSIQAVNQYRLGQSFPKVENLIKIADYYGVSIDYLFGITSTKNRDTTIQSAREYTGLSEENMVFLNKVRGSFLPRMIDFLLDDARVDDGDDKTFLKLLRFFLEYDGGQHPNRRINVHGDMVDTPIPNNGLRTDTIMLDEHIVENAVLEEIKKRLLTLKEGYKHVER